MARPKIALIGAGQIGGTLAHLIALKDAPTGAVGGSGNDPTIVTLHAAGMTAEQNVTLGLVKVQGRKKDEAVEIARRRLIASARPWAPDRRRRPGPSRRRPEALPGASPGR